MSPNEDGLSKWLFKRLGVPKWGQILVIVLFIALGRGFLDLSNIQNRLARIEGKLGLPLEAQLLLDAKVYAEKNDNANVVKSIDRARAVINTAKDNHVTVPDEYFVKSIEIINDLQHHVSSSASDELFSTRRTLAEYRSSLLPAPQIPGTIGTLPVSPGNAITPATVGGKAVYRITRGLTLPPRIELVSDGAFINGSEIPAGEDILKPASLSLSENKNSVRGLNFMGASQTLDGIEWRDVIFYGVKIRYHGKDLRLENVRFVNCVFDAPDDPQGIQLVDYAALALSSLTIG